ncbi:MAG: tripartite tricarboxylate transporter substrate binding protein [Clostridia bacterium]|nr:tripartite tricarboxylate transporter substrate binding protein [Clostridia bacterium]
MKKVIAVLLLLMLLVTNCALADGYVPSKDMNIRVPFAAGGSADTMARIVAQGLQETFGKTVFINNLTGANGMIAAADMASVKADATEMMVGGIAMFTMAPLFNSDVSLKLEDYQIVTGLNSENQMLFVNPAETGIRDWADLVEYAKDHRIIVGCDAPGGASHMLMTVLFGEAGITAEAVTSSGGAQNLLALAGGNVVCGLAPSSVGTQYVEEGTLIPIVVFDEVPYTGYEGIEVPTAQSFGYNIVFKTCNFIMTSKDSEPAEVEAIYQAILAYSETEDFKTLAANANWEPVLADGETVRANIEAARALCEYGFNTYYAK